MATLSVSGTLISPFSSLMAVVIVITDAASVCWLASGEGAPLPTHRQHQLLATCHGGDRLAQGGCIASLVSYQGVFGDGDS